MSFTDILKTPLGIAGIVGSLAIGGGTVIYVVKEAPPVSTSSSTSSTTTAPKENAGAFPMKFMVEYSRTASGGEKYNTTFECDLTLDFTCGKRMFIQRHAADPTKVAVEWRDSSWIWTPKKIGVSWDELSNGFFLDPQKVLFVQARPN